MEDQNVLEGPEEAAAVAVVEAQEAHCGQDLEGLGVAWRQVAGLECQLLLGHHEVAAGLDLVVDLVENLQDHQDIPVD